MWEIKNETEVDFEKNPRSCHGVPERFSVDLVSAHFSDAIRIPYTFKINSSRALFQATVNIFFSITLKFFLKSMNLLSPLKKRELHGPF